MEAIYEDYMEYMSPLESFGLHLTSPVIFASCSFHLDDILAGDQFKGNEDLDEVNTICSLLQVYVFSIIELLHVYLIIPLPNNTHNFGKTSLRKSSQIHVVYLT